LTLKPDNYEFYEELCDHDCGARQYLCADDPKHLLIGFACMCGFALQVRLTDIKSKRGFSKMSKDVQSWYMEGIRTQTSRMEMARVFSNGGLPAYIEITEELEEEM